RNLRTLDLTRSRVSAGGCDALRKALPGVAVEWSEPNDAAARAVLAVGGKVVVQVEGDPAERTVVDAASLPSAYFRVVRVEQHTPGPTSLWRPEHVLEKLSALHHPTFDKLRALDFSDTRFCTDDLARLALPAGLTELSLARTLVADAGLHFLEGLDSLKRLDLRGAPVTAEGVRLLRDALPDCRIESDATTPSERPL
ncbi:MAG: hypothetical protein ACRDD1_02450, partial [Planctomycetia bacterium]